DNDDIRVVGNTRPDLEGVISSNFTYKRLRVGVSLRYSIGSDILNQALYNKVENISESEVIYNNDRRALYKRWKNQGDIARFKSIRSTSYTPISSRFVQEENFIKGESIHLGYRLDRSNWLDTLGINSFQVDVHLNDIFRLTTVKRERGIDYPFARSITSSIRISF